MPIQVQNFESLDSFFGQYGIVDLYAAAASWDKKSQLVARKVKLMRAPLNPRVFGVLVHKSQQDQLIKKGTQYYVVVNNSKESGTEFVAPQPKKKTPKRLLWVEKPDSERPPDPKPSREF